MSVWEFFDHKIRELEGPRLIFSKMAFSKILDFLLKIRSETPEWFNKWLKKSKLWLGANFCCPILNLADSRLKTRDGNAYMVEIIIQRPVFVWVNLEFMHNQWIMTVFNSSLFTT